MLALGLAVVGLAASVASLIDYLGSSATFCAESGCNQVRESAWAHPLGIPMPVLGIAFFVFLRRASLGQAILATALDREMSNLMGINPQKVFALTAGAGAALAGAAGSLSSMLFPVSPTMGVSFLGAVFVITVLGGIGSVEGCIVAGFLYGLVQAWAAYFLGTSFQEIVAFALFLGVLVIRPQGLFGRAFFGEHA